MPDGCVVDTDVLSYILRDDTRAVPYQQALVGRTVFVSFMTVAELDRWSIQRQWGPARLAQLAAFLAQFVLALPDRALCRMWAEVVDGARQQGRPIATADAWIAATAVALDLPLLTHNTADYAGVTSLRLLPTVTP